MVAASRIATPGSRRTGTAAVMEALGRGAMGDLEGSLAILDRVALAPGTSPRTRVDIGLLLLDVPDIARAHRVIETLDRVPGDPSLADSRLRTRTALALARYPEAVAAAQRAVALAPDRKAPRMLLAQATAERDVREPTWRPSLLTPAARHTPIAGRVLHVVSHGLPSRQSGYAIRTQSLAEAQLSVGLRPLVATRRQEELRLGVQPPARWVVGDVEYGLTSSRPEPVDRPDQALTMHARGIATLAEQHGASVLHAATTWRNLQAALAVGASYGIPVVYEVRGFREDTWAARSPSLVGLSVRSEVESGLETALMHEANAIVTLSDAMRDRLVERGLPGDNITVITNAVDVERFAPIPRDDSLARHLGLDDGPVIGYISTFEVFEGIETLLEAAAELRRRGRRVRCLLVGDGPQSGSLRQVSHRLGIDDGTVVFTGRVAYADINAYYSVIDAFVVPRQDVGVARSVTPLKAYEAMAMERVVVVSRLDPLMDMITEGETGVSFTPADAHDLADVLEPLLVDPERRDAIGRAAGAWVREHRNWRRNAELYLDLYQRLGAA
jgi:glycosyltransferase involved in cell wall biosynthesis